MAKIAIVGSGITALATAWQRSHQGDECTVLETSNKIGGAIQSHREGDYLAEEGPNSIQVNSQELDDFLRGIPGLEELVVEADTVANKRFIVRDGKLHPVPMKPWQAITTPLWSVGGRLRVLKEPFVKAISSETEESAADFVRRRLGNELYEYAVNPLIGGIYAGDPEQLSLRYAFPKLHAIEQAHGGLIRGAIAKMRERRKSNAPKLRKRIVSFQNGLHELPDQLAKALGDRVQTNVSIQSIQRESGAWFIQWNGKTAQYDEVVMTVPSHVLKKLPLEDDLLESIQALETIEYPPVSVLSLAFKRSDIAHPLDGFGALIPECEGHKILGVLFPSSIFKQRAPDDEVMLTAFVGGERQPEFATADTEQVKAIVLEELRQLLGLSGEPTFLHHRHWPKAIPQYKLGYGNLLEKMEQIEADFPGLKLAGNYRTGISLTYCIETALAGN
ncbi:MAG: protoporphyrinogen oxidase [Verrucomicrobiota bacterium]